MDEARISKAEETIAHLLRAVEDLSETVARQGREIDLLERRVRMLLERAAESEAQGGAVILADERPPHW